MRTINQAKYPYRVILASTLMMMQLSSFSAHAIGDDPGGSGGAGIVRPGAAAAAAGSPTASYTPASSSVPASVAADPNVSAGSGTYRGVNRDGSTQQCAPAPGSGDRIRCTIEVRDRKTGDTKQYTFIGQRGTEAVGAGDISFDANGNLVPAGTGGSREVLTFAIEGCSGACPPVANFQLIRGSSNILMAVTDHLRTQAAEVYNKERQSEVLDRRRGNCEVITVEDRNGNEREVRIRGDADKKRYRTSILNCHVQNAVDRVDEDEDDSYERDDEDRDDREEEDSSSDGLLAKFKGTKIGGVLRRHMVSSNAEDRDWAIKRLESLQERFEGDENEVSRYIDIMLEGAKEIDHVFKINGVSEAIPETTVQVQRQFEAAAEAWKRATLRYVNVRGAGDASLEVYALMKARGCQLVTASMSSTNGRVPVGGSQNRCDSIDSAVQDGTRQDTVPATPGTVTGDTTRGNRVMNTSQLPGNQTFYQPVQLNNPNFTPIPGDNIQRSTGVYNQNGTGTVRGRRFGN